MSARDNVLNRIRAKLGKSGPMTDAERAPALARIRQRMGGPRPRMDWTTVPRFKERALSLASTVDEIPWLSDLPRAVAAYLAAKQLPKRAVAWNEFAGLDWAGAGLDVEMRPAQASDLVGITGCFCAIAETGTLMLLSGPDTPARTSLLPETHIAVVPQSRIVIAMEEAWALLRYERGVMPRAVNFVSGPSRTADIDQTISMGAHGPYRVHVVLVDG